MLAWNLLIQSMMLQIMGSKYHAQSKCFEVPDGAVFVIKKLCKSLVFILVYDVAMRPLLLKLF